MSALSSRMWLAGALAGLALPCAATAAPAPAQPPAPQAASSPGLITLYAEPGLKGRHATYKTAALDVERQGFVARSAASTGMWTLCEGGEVASRCQTVDGQAPELKLEPQIARPGLNALALYAQPGLKGERVIYSFPADRPAPFHARSARTWGGPWSLCDRGFKHCQTLDGRSERLDLVVAAVRPEAAAPASRTAAAPLQVVHVDTPARKPAPAHAFRVAHDGPARPRVTRSPAIAVREQHARAFHAARHSVLIAVHEPRRVRRHPSMPRQRPSWPVRFHRFVRHAPHVRLLHQVSERAGRHSHAVHRRLYRRVHLAWGGDPYLYDVEPRAWGPPPPGW